MRAGALRHRVIVQKRVVTQDTFGQQVTNWIDLLSNAAAAIKPLSGRELVAAQAINAELTHSVTLRFNRLLADPTQNAALRVIYVTPDATRYFNVSSSLNVNERNRQIEFMAVEGLNKQ